jgi:DNA polymerase III subunit alpha
VQTYSLYAPLHLHSTYSTLDGFGHIERYVERAVELGLPALALTDHGNLSGWLDLLDAAGSAGIKPLPGLEAYQARKSRFDHDEEELAGPTNDFEQRGPYHLTLLARTDVGYRNLIKLSSRAFLDGYYRQPRLDHELLAEHADGLIILSGCLNGEVQQALLRDDPDAALAAAAFFQDAVGRDNFYIELMDHGIPEQRLVNPALLGIAKALSARVVATGDCHYVDPSDAHRHDFALCVSTSATLDQEQRFRFNGPNFHLHTPEEMAALFEPEWLSNTLRVAESVELSPQFGNVYFPDFPLPGGGTQYEDYFEELVWQGLRQRYGIVPSDEVVERAKYEIRVIKAQGFVNYFLVVSDLTRWADENNVRRGPGRGSSAGSICSYALGITGLDPLRFGLLFERFLVEGRKNPPDIDLDFDDRHRDRVIDYAREKYGTDRVVNICTFNRIGARQAIRDSARVLGCTFAEGDKVAKMVPPPVMGFSKGLGDVAGTPDMVALCAGDSTSRRIVDSAFWLEGLIRQTGMHAAGVVISPSATTDYVPVMQKGVDKPVVTQWDMEGVERCGQLKIDFLGLRNLGTLDLCLEMLGADAPVLEELPLDDKATYELLCQGHSKGVFQLEGENMRELMQALAPTCIEDLMALVALYRPGPLGSGMDKQYVERKHGRSAVHVLHPKLESVLATTYGLIVYQEDVLAVVRTLADFSAAEADDLRKAIGKKQVDKIGLFRQRFVEGCVEHSAMPRPRGVANQLYSDIEHHGAYSFNRAHAASYGLIAYWTAYCKAHFPDQYMAALLSSVSRVRDKTAAYLQECRRLQIKVLPPEVGRSQANFRVTQPGEILYGFLSIDGIGPAVAEPLMNGPVYANLHQFMRNAPLAALDKGAIERLLFSGAFDHFAADDFMDAALTRADRGTYLEREHSCLSAYVTEHPMAGVDYVLESQVTAEIGGLAMAEHGSKVTVGGVISGMKLKPAKRGGFSLRFDIEDLTGFINVFVFPGSAERVAAMLSDGGIALVDGRVSHEGDDEHQVVRLLFSDCRIPELPEDIASGPPIRLRTKCVPDHSKISMLSALVEAHPGDSPVYLEVQEGPLALTFQMSAAVAPEVRDALEEVIRERI